MKKLKQAFIRYHIFHKRLFLRPAFLLLLALIPIAGLMLGLVAKMDSGIITVYLASMGESEIADKVIGDLMEDNGIISFIESSPEEAIEAVRGGKAATAWIFDIDTDSKLVSFSKNGTQRHAFISVYQREEDISLLLAREKLCGALYPYISREVFLSFTKKNITEELNDDELLSYYDAVMAEGAELFEISVGEAQNAGSSEANYISAPLRGLLAVMCVLSGLAMAMFYKLDKRKGLFSEIERGNSLLFPLGYHFAGVLDIGIAMVISLYFSGIFTSLRRELLTMLLFTLSNALFCMIIGRLIHRLELLCAVTPLAVIGILVVCPVFFSIVSLKHLRMLLPPYYYLNAVYNDEYILSMLIYICVLFAVYLLLMLLPERERKDA